MENEKNPYQKRWEEYRKRRNTTFLIFFSPFLLMLFIAILNLFGFSFDKNWGSEFLLFIFWAVAYLISLIWFHRWPCPRCGQSFFTYSFWVTSPVLMDKCSNCKLPKYYGSTFYN